MADAVLIVLLLAAAGATVQLTRGAVRHWRGQRAGRPYELPVDHRGTALRAGSAGAAAVTVAALGVALLNTGAAEHPHPARAAVVRPQVHVPPPPSRTPEPAPPAPTVRTVGHPSGGTLQVLSDGTRVWLPPRYDSRRAANLAYPVVVAYLGGGTGSGTVASDLYAGFVRAADRHEADLFVVVVPPKCAAATAPAKAAGPVGAAGSPQGGSVNWPVPGHAGRSAAAPSAPGRTPIGTPGRTRGSTPSRTASGASGPAGATAAAAQPSTAAVLAEVGARYRVLSAQSARGVLGAGPQAACAVGEAFGAPARYGAAVGVSGTYPAVGAATSADSAAGAKAPAAAGTRPWLSAGAPHPPLLLVTAVGDNAARTSARRLRDTLRPAGGGTVRMLTDVAPQRQEFEQAAAYLTEKLDGPRRRGGAR